MARGQPEGEQGYQVETSPENLPRKMVPEIRSLPLAGAAEQFGTDVANTLDRKYRADSAAYAGDTLAQFRLSAVKNLEDMKANAPAGDPGNFTETWAAKFDQQAKDTLGAAQSNPYASAIINKGVGNLRDTLTQHTMEWEANTRVAYRTDSIRQNLTSQLPIVEAHPELAGQVGSSLMDQINSSGAEPAARLPLARMMHEQLSMAAANGMARQDPRSVLEALNNPEKAPQTIRDLNEAQIEQVRDRANRHLSDPVFAAISQGDIRGAQRMLNQNADVMDPRTFESVQRGILATDEHNLVMQEKYQKVASDNLSKQGDQLLSEGKLSADWIAQHSKALEANEVRYFYKALSGGEESATNSRTYADLALRAANGEDVRDDARHALVDTHELSRQDFSKIAGMVDSTRPGWYKRGSQYINETLKPSELEKDPAGHQSLAYALRDWDDWAEQNPKATLDQAKAAQDNIANHYRIVPEGQTALMSRAPQYLVGSRTMPVDEQGKPDPNLSATVRRFQIAVKSGEISGSAAEAEAVRIQSLRLIMQRQIANAAAAKAKREAQQ